MKKAISCFLAVCFLVPSVLLNAKCVYDPYAKSSNPEYVRDMIAYYLELDEMKEAVDNKLPIVFEFEGCGEMQEGDYENRRGSFTVVYTSNEKTPLTFFGSTVPDAPVQNLPIDQITQGYGSATVNDGIYKLYRTSHLGSYAALNLRDFSGNGTFTGMYVGTDGYAPGVVNAINLHTRKEERATSTAISNGYMDCGGENYQSQGCQLVETFNTRYNEFMEIFGISNASGSTWADTDEAVGVILIDRHNAVNWMKGLYRFEDCVTEITSFSSDHYDRFQQQKPQEYLQQQKYLQQCTGGMCFAQVRTGIANKECTIRNVPSRADDDHPYCHILLYVNPGDKMSLSGQIYSARNNLYYEVPMEDGTTGYIYSGHVDLDN